MTCRSLGTVVICGEPMEEIYRESLGERWCFVCRKRREFSYRVTAPVGISYYGPNPSIRCDTCERIDGDCFPGSSREWE